MFGFHARGAPGSRRIPGNRSRTAASASGASRRESAAPMQSWIPCPKARCLPGPRRARARRAARRPPRPGWRSRGTRARGRRPGSAARPAPSRAGRDGGCAAPGWKRRSSSTAAPHASAALRRPSRAGVLEEGEQPVPDQVRRRLVAGEQEGDAGADELVGIERVRRRGDQQADEVGAGALGGDARSAAPGTPGTRPCSARPGPRGRAPCGPCPRTPRGRRTTRRSDAGRRGDPKQLGDDHGAPRRQGAGATMRRRRADLAPVRG
jgi:hypothetical protein